MTQKKDTHEEEKTDQKAEPNKRLGEQCLEDTTTHTLSS